VGVGLGAGWVGAWLFVNQVLAQRIFTTFQIFDEWKPLRDSGPNKRACA